MSLASQRHTRSGRHGAWTEGGPVGRRQFARLGGLELEAGGRVPEVVLAYETWGTLNAERDNAVLVEHALTGDSHVEGPAGPGHPSPGWWDGLIGPGRPLDTDRHFVLCANVLGGCQGSTGPSSTAPDGRPWGSRFPFLTLRDQVRAEALLADHLGIPAWEAVLGGSMGGMRALEWATTFPERVRTCVALATTPYATAEQIAWCAPQLHAIRSDANFRDGDYYDRDVGPEAGLGVARRIAHVTYRSELELADRFGRGAQQGEQPFAGGRYAVESYLDHHAGKIVSRFDANSYCVLTEAMSSHDIGRDRGGLAEAIATFPGQLVVASVDSDRLYPPRLSDELAAAAGVPVHPITSVFGHDGFLIEIDQVGEVLRAALASARSTGS